MGRILHWAVRQMSTTPDVFLRCETISSCDIPDMQAIAVGVAYRLFWSAQIWPARQSASVWPMPNVTRRQLRSYTRQLSNSRCTYRALIHLSFLGPCFYSRTRFIKTGPPPEKSASSRYRERSVSGRAPDWQDNQGSARIAVNQPAARSRSSLRNSARDTFPVRVVGNSSMNSIIRGCL